MNIRDQPPDTHSSRTVASLAGEAAAGLDPALLEEHPRDSKHAPDPIWVMLSVWMSNSRRSL